MGRLRLSIASSRFFQQGWPWKSVNEIAMIEVGCLLLSILKTTKPYVVGMVMSSCICDAVNAVPEKLEPVLSENSTPR